MKKLFSLLVCMLLLSVCFFGCGSQKTTSASGTISKLPPPGSRRLVVFGDSIAAGYGLENQAENYVSIFAENIGAELKNNAVSGDSSAELLALLSKTRADIQNADILLISIGGNDLLHQKDLMIDTLKNVYLHNGDDFPNEVEAIYTRLENNLRACLALIRQQNPDAVILLQTVYNPILKQGYQLSLINVGKLANRYIDRLNNTIHAACSDEPNVYVLDIADRMNQDSKNFYDAKQQLDVHPTVHGHASLAQLITDDFNMLAG